ncbi:helix-turn-helix transcriptional regulator [Nocardioides sp.]|uniref:helix-turn-helix transcriptional regulator n=1 Tax=Nocardioides sp. TaxID=35761 RepID=UPI002728992E|nr:helix-turn-helix transcriptional regulator [Nocardioides sp.]MDO9457803.1 AAA family ATPase [Nocardioides sp.]
MIQSSTTMVGRDAELTEIASSLGVRPSRSADRLVDVLLAGDAGVGKTRLLRALRDVAVDEGWQVYAGHCLDFGDSALPYLPFSEVLGRLATEQPEVVAEVAATHPALARLQPVRRQMAETDPVDAEASALDRADLFRAMLAVLEAAARRAPLLLVIEDTHWADQSTRDMLSFLLSRVDSGGFAVVASYRSDDLHRRHPLRRQVAEWSRLRGVDRVNLSPLADDDVRSLVRQLVPGGLPESELADVVARAEGNAFFVEELVSAAAEPGTFIPADLADVLLVRLDRLDDDARQVVRAASASGRRVTHELLEATSGLSSEALDAGLRGAVEMNVLVTERGAYAFRHALLGEAVYDDLLPGERARLHARYVAVLRDGSARGTAAELARHARLAMDRTTALQASVRAGNEAQSVGGPDEAAYHYQQALEILSGDLARGDRSDLGDHGIDLSKLVVKAADALVTSGDPERAIAVIGEQLERLPDDASDTWRARMLSAQAAAIYITEIDAEIDPVVLSAQAVALAPPGESGLRARVLANHAKILAAYGRFDEAETAGVDALELAERLDLHELASDAITTLSGLKKAGPKEGLRTALAEAVDRAVESEAIDAELRGRFLLGRSYEDWGEFDEAERWFAGGIERATSAGVPWAPYGFEARWQLSWIHLVRGEWDRALDLFVVEGPFPPPIPRAMLTSMRLQILQNRGDDVGARVIGLRPFWRREGAIAIHAASIEMISAGRKDEPAAAVASYDEAVAVLSRIWHEWFSARIRLAAVAIGVLADAMAHRSAAERDVLAKDVDRLHTDGHIVLDRYTDPSGHWGPEGRAWVKRLDAETLRARWQAGIDAPPLDVLVATWREAETLFADFGHVHELAVVRTRLSGILRASGDLAGARELGDQARAVAHALGAQPLLDELQAIGSAPAARTEAPAVTLTTREREILGHVADGRTNGEIAKLLFISAKTVSVHVSNILGKLDASGRTEAAAIARRTGLID